jgi:uncharacterized damage-inducible protein DinB
MSELTQQIGRHFREMYVGDNWTEVDLQHVLSDVNWQQAVRKMDGLNTIAALVFHMNYYVERALNVLQGGALIPADQSGFEHEPIESEADWQKLVGNVLENGKQFATQIEQLEESKLYDVFGDPKYGNYYRNLQGIIEHNYYHLGQISLIKKLQVSN